MRTQKAEIRFSLLLSAAAVLLSYGCSDDAKDATKVPVKNASDAGSTTGGTSTGNTTTGSTTTGNTTTGSTTTGSTTTGSTTDGTTTAGSSDGGTTTPSDPVSLPFAVTSFFSPSGHMGAVSPPAITPLEGVSGPACMATRPAGAVGNCYSFEWTNAIPANPAADAGAADWAGVFWLDANVDTSKPDVKWDSLPRKIAAGAKKVTFYAAGAVGGERVEFFVGGAGPADLEKVSAGFVTLTTTLTQYTISVEGKPYPNGIAGGFGWVSEAKAPGSIKFYLDSIQWE